MAPLLFPACTLVLVAVCAANDVSGQRVSEPTQIRETRIFEFKGGNAFHFEGFGAWKVRLASGSTLSISHDVRGRVTDHGTFSLAEADRAEDLWDLVDAVDFDDAGSSRSTGVPDEIQYTLTLIEGDTSRSITVWQGNVSENPAVEALIERISDLIEGYTGETPVLRY